MKKGRMIAGLAAVAASVLLGYAGPADSKTGGCVLHENTWPNEATNSCWPRVGYNCYDCWYSDHENDGFEHCAESPDGTLEHCEFHEMMRDL